MQLGGLGGGGLLFVTAAPHIHTGRRHVPSAVMVLQFPGLGICSAMTTLGTGLGSILCPQHSRALCVQPALYFTYRYNSAPAMCSSGCCLSFVGCCRALLLCHVVVSCGRRVWTHQALRPRAQCSSSQQRSWRTTPSMLQLGSTSLTALSFAYDVCALEIFTCLTCVHQTAMC